MFRRRSNLPPFWHFICLLLLNVLIFTQSINLHEGRLHNKMHLRSTLKDCFFCVKRFWPITRVENNSQAKFTILNVPHIGFLCYSNWDQFCYMEDGWKVSMNICTALWSFVNFCCLSQSEVSTDNRKVSTYVRCRCCYRSYLDRFLKVKHSFRPRYLPQKTPTNACHSAIY